MTHLDRTALLGHMQAGLTPGAPARSSAAALLAHTAACEVSWRSDCVYASTAAGNSWRTNASSPCSRAGSSSLLMGSSTQQQQDFSSLLYCPAAVANTNGLIPPGRGQYRRYAIWEFILYCNAIALYYAMIYCIFCYNCQKFTVDYGAIVIYTNVTYTVLSHP
jgi:hypothetical protein